MDERNLLSSDDEQMIIAPCDHMIEDDVAYCNDVMSVISQKNKLNFLVVKPWEINSQYGHVIFRDGKFDGFLEKPCEEIIHNLRQKNIEYFWNSGIYIVNCVFLYHLIKEFLIFDEKNHKFIFLPIENLFFLDNIFENFMKNLSIDLFFQEIIKSKNLEFSAYQINFDWLDIGCLSKISAMGL